LVRLILLTLLTLLFSLIAADNVFCILSLLVQQALVLFFTISSLIIDASVPADLACVSSRLMPS
jgi:hypothetical protein